MQKRKNISYIVNETIEEFGKVRVICKIQNVLDDVGLNMMELSNLTGIRYATLNELKQGKKVTLNLQHLLAIMVALRINDFNQLFELQFDDAEGETHFEKENVNIHENQMGMPDETRVKIQENKIKLENYYADMQKEKALE